MKNDQLTIPATTEALATVQPPNVALMIGAMVERGITKDNADAFGKMIEYHIILEKRESEKQFVSAFVAMQSEIPAIRKDREVPDKFGNVKFSFASYETIHEAVKPCLQKHGFSPSFPTRFEGPRVIVSCTLQHIAGHSRTNEFAARIGSGPPGSSEAQGDGAAATYAKRFAFCQALDITIDNDTDGRDDVRNEGETIAPDKMAYIEELLKETSSDTAKFLAMAGVDSIEKIRNGSYDVLVRALKMKVKK